METSHGWLRAQLRLEGLEVEYNSLKEAYLLSALNKKQRVEVKRILALAAAAAGAKSEAIQKAVNSYLEEAIPALAESREAFIELGKEILEKEAGSIQQLSDFVQLS